ncbi:MAG: hypothetical protein WA840_10205 [Caulobacteraceae bacterium]
MDRTYQDRADVIRGVGKRLIGAESSIDAAFIELAALAAELPTARQEAGLAFQVGVEAATYFATALAQLGQVRETMAKGHKRLAAVQSVMGISIGIGGGDKGSQSAALTEEFA